MLRLITGIPGPSGFGSASTAEQVTQGIDASNLTAIITGLLISLLPLHAFFQAHCPSREICRTHSLQPRYFGISNFAVTLISVFSILLSHFMHM